MKMKYTIYVSFIYVFAVLAVRHQRHFIYTASACHFAPTHITMSTRCHHNAHADTIILRCICLHELQEQTANCILNPMFWLYASAGSPCLLEIIPPMISGSSSPEAAKRTEWSYSATPTGTYEWF